MKIWEIIFMTFFALVVGYSVGTAWLNFLTTGIINPMLLSLSEIS